MSRTTILWNTKKIAAIALATSAVVLSLTGCQPGTSTTTTPTPPSSGSSSSGSSSSSTTGTYKDGTYTVVGDYISPGGAEQIGVTATLKNGILTDVEAEPKAQRPTSVKYQGIFKDNFKPLVVGKNIDEVRLDKVSGSSLTPKGFNDALEKIKAQAKA